MGYEHALSSLVRMPSVFTIRQTLTGLLLLMALSLCVDFHPELSRVGA